MRLDSLRPRKGADFFEQIDSWNTFILADNNANPTTTEAEMNIIRTKKISIDSGTIYQMFWVNGATTAHYRPHVDNE